VNLSTNARILSPESFLRRFSAIRKSYKGMSAEKHFSPPERQKYSSGIQPNTILPTFLL